MPWFRIVVASLVVVVWLVGYVIAYVTGSDRPEELTGLMVLVVGWALGSGVKDAIASRLKRALEEAEDDAPKD